MDERKLAAIKKAGRLSDLRELETALAYHRASVAGNCAAIRRIHLEIRGLEIRCAAKTRKAKVTK
jgi:hypothetical protein